MLRRAFLLLAGTAGLSACATSPYPAASGYYGGTTSLAPGRGLPGAGSGKVAVLLPLSGAHADIARSMLQAAQLALSYPGSPALVSEDTAGTLSGAAAAAHAALAAGATMVLGPLTAPEAEAAARITRNAGVPMLAFSNDPAIAQPGVWPLGITPTQQVRRLVDTAQQAGRVRLAALLPNSAFGRALADALERAASTAGLAPPSIQFHGGGMASINRAAQIVSDYQARWGPIEAQIRAARAEGTAEGRRRADQLGRSVLPPPPFDVLLLGDIGEPLTELAAVLPYYFVGQPTVQIMGPSLWANPRSGSGQFRGAWYAAPDPGARIRFVQAYTARYGEPPPSLADIAYDAASIARVLAASGHSVRALTAHSGFTGATGALAFLPNGEVRRGLAVFAIEPGAPRLVTPAPVSVTTAT